MGKDLKKKQLLSVICAKRLRLESCQEAATECFHQAESDCVSVAMWQLFHICGRESMCRTDSTGISGVSVHKH